MFDDADADSLYFGKFRIYIFMEVSSRFFKNMVFMMFYGSLFYRWLLGIYYFKFFEYEVNITN